MFLLKSTEPITTTINKPTIEGHSLTQLHSLLKNVKINNHTLLTRVEQIKIKQFCFIYSNLQK